MRDFISAGSSGMMREMIDERNAGRSSWHFDSLRLLGRDQNRSYGPALFTLTYIMTAFHRQRWRDIKMLRRDGQIDDGLPASWLAIVDYGE